MKPMETTYPCSDPTKLNASGSQSPDAVESLRDEILCLNDRISALEKLLVAKPNLSVPVHRQTPALEELSVELVLVISAAVAAYLGVEPHIRQIRLLHSHPWGQQGRVTIQASHRIAAGQG
jgi:methylmalonyl-CoA carboxyltransferase 12S subunit